MRAKETATNSERIFDTFSDDQSAERPLFDCTATRALEQAENVRLDPHTLMQRAGLAVARLAMAMTPHASVIWIPCGPGNNGGDGYEAARNLKLWGKSPVVTCVGSIEALPIDAQASRRNALQAGVVFADTPPESYDLCIDALFGIGAVRPFDGQCSDWIQRINSGTAPVLAVDIPSGLNADTGEAPTLLVKATATLSLLTLKPGLFTADGRETCGEIWFNDLEVAQSAAATAYLSIPSHVVPRAHNTHKGSYGDIAVIGGSHGMTGAALLAARAALRGGAGRVYVCLLDSDAPLYDTHQPELMFRSLSELSYESMTVVAGCGGGDAIHAHLKDILRLSVKLVLDADALNAIAKDTSLQELLAARPAQTTVLTPHPLEAARLMQVESGDIQSNRLATAQLLADRFACIVVLKGSGTVIAAPSTTPRINPTGNARLASAGTGDVLAGLIGARMAVKGDVFSSVCGAVFRHGQVADDWSHKSTLTAHELAQSL